jgi:hypothetical protein
MTFLRVIAQISQLEGVTEDDASLKYGLPLTLVQIHSLLMASASLLATSQF